MFKIALTGVKNENEFEELIKLFLRPDEYEICGPASADAVFRQTGTADELKREIYRLLSGKTGRTLPWGILTGVRPVKKLAKLARQEKARGAEDPAAAARALLVRDFYVSAEKADLAAEVYSLQQEVFGTPARGSVSVYIDIPFCPTRCLYCSFASNQCEYPEVGRYLSALGKEMRYVSREMRSKGLSCESIYIGGGTPTTLHEDDFDDFLAEVEDLFADSSTREFTVEMGRPDTITERKVRDAARRGARRISINPQTMNDRTLELIGRAHTSDDIREAFRTAKAAADVTINADLIAGLPGEDAEDFRYSLSEVTGLGPQDITVHCLSVKRSSRLRELDEDFHYRQGEVVTEMIDHAGKALRGAGYRPYYLYRQKHMSGAAENTGYALPGAESLYNVRIMDESQTIIGMGASGMTKVYFPDEDRLERVPNVSNYEIYIDRIDEMIRRKKEGLFNAY
ncbi:MAG: coproporphyrinogen dehydrogenase HemZ [Anaerovoracaceae bacterium]